MQENNTNKSRSSNKSPRTRTGGGKPERSGTSRRKPERSRSAEGKSNWPRSSDSKTPKSGTAEGKPGRPGRKPKSDRTSSGKGSSDRYDRRSVPRGKRKSDIPTKFQEEPEKIRLNKFIAHAGICSRREADNFITAGNVQVNGKRCTELGVLVSPNDRVMVNGQTIEPEPFVYFLMNKPRDTITTTSDERGRKTVMDLIEHATGLRVYPVGRLDRNTTGLILLTNDGDLANRLMHPSYKVRKVYEVETDREITDDELRQFRTGISLDDGPARAYRASRHPEVRNTVTLSMHEGRNRVVRRMFEAIEAEVVKLDRVIYGPLQKKGLRIGRWRKLRNHEINELRKMVRLLPMEHLDRR